ncbi:hypothetical protein OHB41_03735 [Streptomyces sp. NBC_01571]|nr:hypothetical protein [Streptomyces sp. NBC_01571]MCX4572310.1 hypothetical protein [Streptomyces sp. NBC_01571]
MIPDSTGVLIDNSAYTLQLSAQAVNLVREQERVTVRGTVLVRALVLA